MNITLAFDPTIPEELDAARLVLSGLQPTAGPAHGVIYPVAAAAEAPAPKRTRTAKPKPEPVVVPAEEEPTPDDAPMALADPDGILPDDAPEPGPSMISLADLQTIAKNVVVGSPSGRDTLKGVLAAHGATRLSELTPEQYVTVAEALA